jgi:hypothetical protein
MFCSLLPLMIQFLVPQEGPTTDVFREASSHLVIITQNSLASLESGASCYSIKDIFGFQLSTVPNKVPCLDISRNGRVFAFARDHRVFVATITGGLETNHILDCQSTVEALRLSTDGTKVAICTTAALVIGDCATGELLSSVALDLSGAASPFAVSWNSRGTQCVIADGAGCKVWFYERSKNTVTILKESSACFIGNMLISIDQPRESPQSPERWCLVRSQAWFALPVGVPQYWTLSPRPLLQSIGSGSLVVISIGWDMLLPGVAGRYTYLLDPHSHWHQLVSMSEYVHCLYLDNPRACIETLRGLQVHKRILP